MKAAWETLPANKAGYQYTVKPGTPPQAVIRCGKHQQEEVFPVAKK